MRALMGMRMYVGAVWACAKMRMRRMCVCVRVPVCNSEREREREREREGVYAHVCMCMRVFVCKYACAHSCQHVRILHTYVYMRQISSVNMIHAAF